MESALVGTQIVQEVSAREGVDPVDLTIPLFDMIDSDALESLVKSTSDSQPQANLRVEFAYYGYVVTVHGSGRVTIDEQSTDVRTDGSLLKESAGD